MQFIYNTQAEITETFLFFFFFLAHHFKEMANANHRFPERKKVRADTRACSMYGTRTCATQVRVVFYCA